MRHTPEKTTGDLAPAGAFKAYLECLKMPISLPRSAASLLSPASPPKSFAGVSFDTTFLLIAQKKRRDLMDPTLCLMSQLLCFYFTVSCTVVLWVRFLPTSAPVKVSVKVP